MFNWQTFLTIGGALGWIIAGVLAVIGMFNKQSRDRRTQDDQTAANLINNLKTTVDLQEKQLATMSTEKVAQGKEIANLQGQLTVVNKLLENRDPQVQAFLKEVPILVTAINESNVHSKSNQEAVINLTNMMADFLKKVTPHLNGATPGKVSP